MSSSKASQTADPVAIKPVRKELTLAGDPKNGKVVHIGWIHQTTDHIASNKTAADVIRVQERILRDLQKIQPKHIAIEGLKGDILPNQDGRQESLMGLLIQELFGNEIPKGELNEQQKRCLWAFGAPTVYAYFNRDVSVYKTSTPDEDRIESQREPKTLNSILNFFKDPKHRELTLYVAYGAAHTFGPEDLPRGMPLKTAPQIVKYRYDKLVPPNKEIINPLEPAREMPVGKGGGSQGITWKELKAMSDRAEKGHRGEMPDLGEWKKITVLVATEWHLGTQAKMLDTIGKVLSPSQFGSILTPELQLRAIDKLRVTPSYWQTPENLLNHLSGNAKNDSVKNELKRRFDTQGYPFSLFKK